MAAEIVNLRQARKVKARAKKERQAEQNRLTFGRTKAEKNLTKALNEKAEKTLDQGKRERPADEPPAGALPAKETEERVSDAHLIHTEIDTFVAMIYRGDPAVIDRLWGNGGLVFVGSEKGETFRSHAELDAKFRSVLEKPARFRFDWPNRTVTVSGDVAWAFVDGDLVIEAPEGERRSQYLASMVFERQDGAWRWRQFVGSEPG